LQMPILIYWTNFILHMLSILI